MRGFPLLIVAWWINGEIIHFTGLKVLIINCHVFVFETEKKTTTK